MPSTIFSKISNVLLAALIFLTPLFILPFSTDFFLFPKVNLFLFLTFLAAFFWLLDQAVGRKITIKGNPFLYPLFLLFAVNFASFIANYRNLEKFASLWECLPFLIFPLFSFLLTLRGEKEASWLKNLLLASGVVISGLGIYLFLLPPSSYPLNFKVLGFPVAILNSAFSPTGNSVFSLIFLLTLIPFIVKNFSEYLTEKDTTKGLSFLKIIFISLLTLEIIIGIGIFAFQAFSLGKPVLLPSQTGWAIAIETFKNPLNALLGTGPGSFLSAFTRFKPVDYNLSSVWGVRFSSSSNEVFQILTTLGLASLAVYLFLFLRFLKTSPRGPGFYSALILFLTMIFLPSNFFFYFLLVIYLSLASRQITPKSQPETYFFNDQVATGLMGLSLALLLVIFYFLGRNLSAEVHFRKSLIAAANNQASDTYRLQVRAIAKNPYRADLHQIHSQTDLVIANAIASNKNLSDQDRQTITQLVQEAITEARNGVILAPLDITAWENLNSTYRQLINFAQGADTWAIATSQQALRLDPNNPQLYLNLGGLYYSLGRIDDAINLFQASVSLKPDFANGFYNLSAAFKEKKDYQKAYEAMNQVIRIVPIDSADYQKVQKELEDLKQKLPKPTPTGKIPSGESTLKLPEPLPSPKAQITPIELPPPEETPTPTPE
jgi:tetratricopeptide (TPR) repeat protein